MDNVEESFLSEQLGFSYVVGRPLIATVTIKTTQPAPVAARAVGFDTTFKYFTETISVNTSQRDHSYLVLLVSCHPSSTIVRNFPFADVSGGDFWRAAKTGGRRTPGRQLTVPARSKCACAA